jgi:hypothetical protein
MQLKTQKIRPSMMFPSISYNLLSQALTCPLCLFLGHYGANGRRIAPMWSPVIGHTCQSSCKTRHAGGRGLRDLRRLALANEFDKRRSNKRPVKR